MGCRIGSAWFACALVGSFSVGLHAGQSRTANDRVYADGQAKRGQVIYHDRCSSCHGETLEGGMGPPLTGDEFIGVWGNQPLSDLVNKIQSTMPAPEPGTTTRQQAADIVAYMLQVGKFPAGQAELRVDEAVLKQITFPAAPAPSPRQQTGLTAGQASAFPPFGNLAQVMRGILFPSSNVIFNVQTKDPGAKKDVAAAAAPSSLIDRFADVYQGWSLVDFAAVALVDSSALMVTPGRRCENGKPVPVDRPDWIKFTQDLSEAGKAAYRASQSRNRDAVIEVTNQVSDACFNCHNVYRDRPGGDADRCVPGR